MKAVVQRVTSARVTVDGNEVGSIGPGLLVYLGLEKDDTEAELAWLGTKILGMRVFADEQGRMNLDLGDRELLLISQFTLAGDLSRGRRPGFENALPVELARDWWSAIEQWFRTRHSRIATGQFQADMQIESVNDGPATFILDSAGAKSGQQPATGR